jgi:uncharacterized membrane protein
MALAMKKSVLSRPVITTQRRATLRVLCQSQSNDDKFRQAIAMPIASMVAAALIAGAVVPEQALAARSSGRAGGSSGFSARKSASSSVQRSST